MVTEAYKGITEEYGEVTEDYRGAAEGDKIAKSKFQIPMANG
jgi:hypothetical protein